jgi:hypothetical protein
MVPPAGTGVALGLCGESLWIMHSSKRRINACRFLQRNRLGCFGYSLQLLRGTEDVTDLVGRAAPASSTPG